MSTKHPIRLAEGIKVLLVLESLGDRFFDKSLQLPSTPFEDGLSTVKMELLLSAVFTGYGHLPK